MVQGDFTAIEQMMKPICQYHVQSTKVNLSHVSFTALGEFLHNYLIKKLVNTEMKDEFLIVFLSHLELNKFFPQI